MKTKTLACLTMAAAVWMQPFLGPVRAQDGELALQLGYEGRLLIKVLDIEIQERAGPSGFSADALLTSAGLLALIKHIHQHAAAQGAIVGGEPHPGVFETQKLDGKTRRRVRTVWDRGEVTMSAEPAFNNLGDPPVSPTQALAAADPLTALVRMTLNGSRRTTCGRTYLFFDGKQLYALDAFSPTDTVLTDKAQRLGLIDPFSCDVRFREVAGFSKKPPNQRNQGLQKPIRMDFARMGANGPLLVTGLHAETPLGEADIELDRLQAIGARTASPS